MAAGAFLLEAKIGAQRVARLGDVASDGGISAAQTKTGDNVHVGPLPVFTGAESLSSARAGAPLCSWTRSKNNGILVHECAGSGLPVRAGDQARSNNETIDTPIVQSLSSSVVIQNKIISEGSASEFAESQRWQGTPAMLPYLSNMRRTQCTS
jgi:hypothetical protein